MTILEAKGKLFNYFIKKDTFSFEKNFFEALQGVTETEELDKAIFSKALEDLQKDNIVHKVSNKENDWWVLSQPLASHNQIVSLSSSTVGIMCDIFAITCEKFGLESLGFNPFNINEKDFMNLFIFLNEFLQGITENEEEISES